MLATSGWDVTTAGWLVATVAMPVITPLESVIVKNFVFGFSGIGIDEVVAGLDWAVARAAMARVRNVYCIFGVELNAFELIKIIVELRKND